MSYGVGNRNASRSGKRGTRQPNLADRLRRVPPYHSRVTSPQFKVSAAIAEHLGDRSEQQDRVAILTSDRNPGTLLAIVADGMGGRTGGRMASDQVVSTATNLFRELSERDTTLDDLLRQIASEAHTVIRLSALSSEKEPHSTIVALFVKRDFAVWGHAGDSRLYWCRAGRVMRRTVDHTVASQLIAEGRHAEAQIAAQHYKNVLFSALGIRNELKLDIDHTQDLRVGDAFLLASDGLWGHFDDAEIATVLDRLPPREATQQLVKLARERAEGHGDNLSLAIVKLESPLDVSKLDIPELRD
jgi:serine/threonine protein phosphatase PrpC